MMTCMDCKHFGDHEKPSLRARQVCRLHKKIKHETDLCNKWEEHDKEEGK